MAAPWPPPYQQVSGPSQACDSNTYQHTTGQYQPRQPSYPPYVQHGYGHPQGQQPYQHQPQKYSQSPANPPGYVQQIHPPSNYHPYQQAQPMPQYQYAPPMQQQQANAQAFGQPQSVPSGYYHQSQPSQISPVQPYQTGNVQQQQQPTSQAFPLQQPSYTPTEPVSQQPQQQQISTPQQQQYAAPPSSISSQSPGPSASPEKDQLQEKKPTVPCFNCGSFDHWAVSCPEPLREVPAGRLIRQSQQPPAKRQKFNAPIITKYQVPTLTQVQNNPPSHQFPSYGHASYVQAPQQYQIPPTPVSAQSPPGHWPQIGHPPPPPTPPQHYPYAMTPQTPTQYFGPSPVTQISPPGPSQQTPGFPPQVQHQVQHQQHYPPSQPYRDPFSSNTSAPPANSQIPHQAFGQPPGTSVSHQGPSPSVPLVQSQETTAKLQPLDVGAANGEEDELSMLDVPDCPAEEGESNPTLVGRPLPTNFVVADALAPFDPPALGDGGRCRSKYLDRSNANDRSQNIKESGEWENVSKDPIFNEITSGGNVILLSVLDLIYRPNRIQEPSDNLEEDLPDDDYAPGDTDPKEESNETNSRDSSPRGRRRRSYSGGAHRAVEGHTPSPRSPNTLPFSIDTEDVVTPPSVDVAAKSMKPISRPYPPPTPQDGTRDPSQFSTSRSASPRRHETYSYHNISPPDSGADGRTRNEDPAVDRRHSYHKEDSSRCWNDRSSTQRPQPVPPPPPPPARRPSMYDGSSSSPLSPESVQISASAFVPDKNFRDGSGAPHGRYPADDYTIPPVRLRAERSYSHKREYAMRDESSDEDETVRRRQADDITPKQKKRQPKVAEAYSRRW